MGSCSQSTCALGLLLQNLVRNGQICLIIQQSRRITDDADVATARTLGAPTLNAVLMLRRGPLILPVRYVLCVEYSAAGYTSSILAVLQLRSVANCVAPSFGNYLRIRFLLHEQRYGKTARTAQLGRKRTLLQPAHPKTKGGAGPQALPAGGPLNPLHPMMSRARSQVMIASAASASLMSCVLMCNCGASGAS